MKQLIDDLLIYAKITMNPEEFEKVDFEMS